MADKLDWGDIQSADYGLSNPSSFTLSLESVKLLLVLLSSRAVFPGAWVVGGDEPTASEWNTIDAFVAGTIRDLMIDITGLIVHWSGAVVDIPAGWTLCDGTNGTPDLRNLFVIGAGGAYSPGDTGGQATVDIQHLHAKGTIGTGGPDSGEGTAAGGVTVAAEDHFHPITGSTANAGSTALDILPPFYALAFVMKV